MGIRQPQSPLDADLNQTDPATAAGLRQGRYALARTKDRGDFKLYYEPNTASQVGKMDHRAGTNPQGIECIIDSLNERIALPFDIDIVFKKCDEPNAFYDDETHQITLCDELIEDYYDLFSDKIKDKAKLDEVVSGVIIATLFHEMGHALIDVWNLPITGKEEDAADQFSNLILIEEMEEGEQMALDSALSLKLDADLAVGEEKLYWDEHSLDEQRFYDILCMLYGHNPERYAYLVKDGLLPSERAGLCKDDYAKVKKSWQMLLAPFVKT